MSKRFDKMIASLNEARRRFADKLALSPATRLVALHETEGDDPSFLDIASRLVTATTVQAGLTKVYAVHIDNWFGPRWLGFCGKLKGIAGVRNKTLKRSLTIPPFHPNRVLQARGHHLRDDGLYADAEDLWSLHPQMPSESNIYRTIRANIIYTWYSGNSLASRKGVVMIYYRLEDASHAFYTMFDGDADWRLGQHIGITRSEVEALLDCPSPGCST